MNISSVPLSFVYWPYGILAHPSVFLSGTTLHWAKKSNSSTYLSIIVFKLLTTWSKKEVGWAVLQDTTRRPLSAKSSCFNASSIQGGAKTQKTVSEFTNSKAAHLICINTCIFDLGEAGEGLHGKGGCGGRTLSNASGFLPVQYQIKFSISNRFFASWHYLPFTLTTML